MGERLPAPSTTISNSAATAAANSNGSKSAAQAASSGSREVLRCPRCDSSNTKFCYYNNYSLAQPRHFCKACKRYWTRGGTLRNVPVGGNFRKTKRLKKSSSAITSAARSSAAAAPASAPAAPSSFPPALSIRSHIPAASDLAATISPLLYSCSDMGLASFPSLQNPSTPAAAFDLQNQLDLLALMNGDYQLQNPQQAGGLLNNCTLFESPLLSSASPSLLPFDHHLQASMTTNGGLGIDLKQVKVEGEQWRIPCDTIETPSITADNSSILYWSTSTGGGGGGWPEANNFGSPLHLSSSSTQR